MGGYKMDIIKACGTGDIKCVKDYIASGNNLNVTIGNGWTPLTSAIEHRQKEIIILLLENGADINFQQYSGFSALHHAVDSEIDGTLQTYGNVEETPIDLITLLLENGADVNSKLDCGSTPLDIAKEYGCNKIVNLLQEYCKPSCKNKHNVYKSRGK